MNNPINNTVFDTRDLQEYIEFLEETLIYMWNDYISEVDNPPGNAEKIEDIDLYLEGFHNRFEDTIEEYEEIKKFAKELEHYSSDYRYGAAVIHENYWEEYCEDFCKEVGYIPSEIPSWIEIDWAGTADNMSEDYSTVLYGTEQYYILST